ncbi:hypothetical protein AYI70_g2362 [Smittium culicis]|uniref:Endonuclease/exonuclease/phosphatase domain-containing protein n=1 Tax=Smittium culicis TaxID=133412 RepID=A0A1R1XBJ1_9FUNG|nr:hypothetical protein AYI70_g9362 [Smittium culicis]OMJ23298.1 hypothetical protein AYI70_g2362 [Smittium culicis]
MNMVENEFTDRFPEKITNKKELRYIEKITIQYNLVNEISILNPNESIFTWEDYSGKYKSRIDHVLIPKNVLDSTKIIDIGFTEFSDHKCITVQLRQTQSKIKKKK